MVTTLVLMVAVFVVTALYFTLSRRRLMPEPDVNLAQFPKISHSLRRLAGLTGGEVYDGNEAVLYENGALLDAMLEAIGAAHSAVHLESYVWNAGEVEKDFVAALCQKAEEGLVVRLLVDAVGAMGASREQMRKLRESGVSVGVYHPIRRFSLRRFNNRLHRKLLIVDCDVGFTFGHGIRDEWRGNAEDKYHWRDTGVRVRGPVVEALQVIFTQDWIEATGVLPIEEKCFRKGEPHGSVINHVVSSSTRGGYSSVALLYMLAMAGARREIIIQNPYFSPGSSMPRMLEKVVANGVEVHLMVPGKYSDSPLVQRAGQHLYERLLRSGVRIYLYNKTFLHQKIVVIDGIWSHIGSTNFDARSLVLNAEIGIGFLDGELANQLKQSFEKDLLDAHELTLGQWQARSRYQSFLDWSAYQLHGQL